MTMSAHPPCQFNRREIEKRFTRLENDFVTLEAMLKRHETMLNNIAKSLVALHNATLGKQPPTEKKP